MFFNYFKFYHKRREIIMTPKNENFLVSRVTKSKNIYQEGYFTVIIYNFTSILSKIL